MVTVSFAKAFRRHVDCPPAEVAAGPLAAVLDQYFARHPAVRSYVLDERGAVRKHVAVFVDDTLVIDRDALTDQVEAGARISIFQALSGGAS